MQLIQLPAPPASCLLRDLSAAFMQQMFFWGMDAAAPGGNLFQKRGFIKSPSTGLKGTSCYNLPIEGGEIFLHGACVGWIPSNGNPGFIFIRPKGRCFLWLENKHPIPGIWPAQSLCTPDLISNLPSLIPFLNWWLDHEAWVSAEMGTAYRIVCHRKYKSLPKSKPWLPPAHANAWLALLMENPAATPRAKRFLATCKA